MRHRTLAVGLWGHLITTMSYGPVVPEKFINRSKARNQSTKLLAEIRWIANFAQSPIVCSRFTYLKSSPLVVQGGRIRHHATSEAVRQRTWQRAHALSLKTSHLPSTSLLHNKFKLHDHELHILKYKTSNHTAKMIAAIFLILITLLGRSSAADALRIL